MKKKETHIGEYIKDILYQMNIKQSFVAQKIGISNQTFSYWLQNDDISVKNICMISEIIGRDLLIPFLLDVDNNEYNDPKVTIQLEIDPRKNDDVLQYIKDQQLYKLLKSKK